MGACFIRNIWHTVTYSNTTIYSASDEDHEFTDEDDDEDDEEVDEEEEKLLYEVIAATAAARGIPLEFIVDRVEREDEPVEYPFDSLPSSLADVSKFILSEKCRSVVILAGAGM
jgi:hypothetical protein